MFKLITRHRQSKKLKAAIQLAAIRKKDIALTEESALAFLSANLAERITPSKEAPRLALFVSGWVALPLAERAKMDAHAVLAEACSRMNGVLSDEDWRAVRDAYARRSAAGKQELLWLAASELHLPAELIGELIGDRALLHELQMLREGRCAEFLVRHAQRALNDAA